MLKLILIPNKDAFINTVNRCQGSVLLHLPDASTCDLKQEGVAPQMLRLLEPGKHGLQISLGNPKDLMIFLRYMQEAACM